MYIRNTCGEFEFSYLPHVTITLIIVAAVIVFFANHFSDTRGHADDGFERTDNALKSVIATPTPDIDW